MTTETIAMDIGNGTRWTKYVIDYKDLNGTAGTSKTIDLFTLPKGGYILKARSKHSTAFAGSGITDMSCIVGSAGFTNWVLADLDIDGTVSDTAFNEGNMPTHPGHAAMTIQAIIGSTGANLTALTQGVVEIFILAAIPTQAIYGVT